MDLHGALLVQKLFDEGACSLNTSGRVFLQVWELKQVQGVSVAYCTTSTERRSH